MPLSTVFVSTVSNRPRLWSSQTNIRIKDKDAMNSTEEISVYKSPQEFYVSPTFSKRSTLGCSYDFPEKPAKKEKKWTIGSLFRRKKKDETESSSEEEQKKGFLGRRRRKSDGKKRKPKTVGGFDHIVLPKTTKQYNGYHEDTGILSDPSGGFSNYIGRSLPLPPQNNQPHSTSNSYTNLNHSVISVTSIGSGDSISKRKGKELVKARAAARRTTLGNESSSDEDSSLRSNSSLHIRSDESLNANLNRRSRAARTERYLKRHSKDGENPHNYLRLSKSDADEYRSPSRSPLPPGLSTIPPSHGVHGKYRISNSTSNPSYKPPLSMNEYNNAVNKGSSLELNNQRSISCDANIHKAPSFEDNNIMHVQFPILRPYNRRNIGVIDSSRQPPQPPPRDPNRTVMSHYFENGRPSTVYCDNNNKSKYAPIVTASRFLQPKAGSFNFRSTSEVHIPNDQFQVTSPVRPASTTPEPKPNRFNVKNRNERHTVDGYNYLTDKKPRSRKPIVIQSNIKVEPRKDSPTQKALDFWKQIEDSVSKSYPNKTPKTFPSSKPTSKSPQIFTSQTHVQSQVFLPSARTPSPFKPINDAPSESNLSNTSKDDVKRKSTNLEEALNELEAIYNSLRLGDENLLDRAEQRENESLVKAAEAKKKQSYLGYSNSRGALSDSSFSYEPFDQVDSPKRKKIVKKGKIPDTKEDDMYNRKLVKEKSATISDPQGVLSRVSYLLASPIHSNAYDSENEKTNRTSNEPDITFDDLMFRNVKRAISSPKTVDPQPPFGIPLGPVSPAPNSDYLHATPGATYTPVFIPKKIPDIVKDDLAFRNLRKDTNKEPVLPLASAEEIKNNIYPKEKLDLNFLKKRRAVRSLSANIGNILGKDVKDSDDDVENEFRNKTLTDIADAMEIARRVLQEKGKNISDTRKAFMSDTDIKTNLYANGDSLKESRLKFLNGLKSRENSQDKNVLSDRPPKGLTPERKIKESTPIPKSALEEDNSTNSSLDDLLNALAEEAKITTERITKELKELEEKRARENASNELSEDLKPCKNLLKAVVDSKDLVEYSKSPSEIVEEIQILNPPAQAANIIQSCFKESCEELALREEEHDYENIDSEEDKLDVNLIEQEVEREEFKKCQSPFEERKAEIVASFQELKDKNKTDSIYDNLDEQQVSAEGKYYKSRSRSRLPRWLRPLSCPDEATMSDNHRDSRAGRIARYKEERRKQLAEQFSNNLGSSPRQNINGGVSSSSSEGPRPTRASRLRAQATTGQIQGISPTMGKLEKGVSPLLSDSPKGKLERDKSSKRKSNLNRSLTCEAAPPNSLYDDPKTARRRRRFFPPEVLEQTPTMPTNEYTASPVTSNLPSPQLPTASISPSASSSYTTHNNSPLRLTPKRSELSIHMENARRSVITPPNSESHKYKPFALRKSQTSSPRDKSSPSLGIRNGDVSAPSRTDKEEARGTIRRSISSTSDKETNQNLAKITDESSSIISTSDKEAIQNIAKRIEKLSAFTRDTNASLEKVANRNRGIRNRQSPAKQVDTKCSRFSPGPSSILKRKPREEKETVVVVVNEPPAPAHAAPVSILKRKVALDEKTESHSTHTPPVTFSPSVVEPATTNRKQGILKKRRSLDESTVMRHRSCSPDVINKISDSRSILKNQRRSSLEELRRIQSPEVHIQGILKRKTSKHEEDDISLNSPQGILKRRSGASSAGSTSSTPHVSITTAVILAAARGAEMILEPEMSQDSVKPILKKKSFSEDYSCSESISSDTPKPILKKKSSTDTDDGEDSKPMRPILKLPKSRNEGNEAGQEGRRYSRFNGEADGEAKPSILKSGSFRPESPRPRLSFCGDASASVEDSGEPRRRSSHRSYTICSDFNVQSNAISRDKQDDRDLKKARPLSVLELVRSFEKQVMTRPSEVKTGAVPKRQSQKRHSDRYRTQPVTSNELEESRNLLRQEEAHSSRPSHLPYHSLAGSSKSLDTGTLDFTCSLEDEGLLNSFLASPFHSTSLQGVGISPESPACHKTSSDSAFQSLGDGLELEEPQEESEELNIQTEMSSLASEMKALAEEAKKKRLERDLAATERRGILKPPQSDSSLPRRSQSFASPRTLLKNRTSPQLETSVLESPRHESAFRKVKPSRTEVSTDKDDEGISCNDSGSDSETSEAKGKPPKFNVKLCGDDTTSEGESSGGREVKSIFRNDNRLNLSFKQQLEGCLSKSKSSSFLRPTSAKSCEASSDSRSFEEPSSFEDSDRTARKGSTNLRRSHTHTAGAMPRSIADLRAKLQENGEKSWMKRVPLNNNSCDELKFLKERNRYNDELSEKTLLASKKDELDAAAKQWKARVEKSDAEKFSVAGKMGEKIRDAVPTINIPSAEKKVPPAKRYKGKEDSSSAPSSPEKNSHFDLTRSKSAISPIGTRQTPEVTPTKVQSRMVPILKPDDYTFTSFFESVEQSRSTNERLEVNPEDFDAVERQSLLTFRKNVQVRRRRIATKNPIKALADRTDIVNEYTEVITGVAEREKKRLNIEKLAQNSNKALEALAGLASNEDFKSVALKKNSGPTLLQPWNDLMLLQIKGRRHIQTRLVEPVASNINEGDCYILITPTVLYNYTGAFSNVIEQSRAVDVANHIQKCSDLGCKAAKVINMTGKDVAKRQLEAFWKLLGAPSVPDTIGPGHPNEDETYESNILTTNMIYTIDDNELIPYDPYWGTLPKIEMLNETNVIVFDFGSEMYVWSGKSAPLDKKRLALKLAKEMWDEGYNYSDCSVNPLNVVEALGERKAKDLPLIADKRPTWALFAKITQHRETVLFREKFLDWPDFSRVIRVRNSDEGLKRGKGSIEIKPCNVDEMLKQKSCNPDLVIQNIHLGRGDQYFDEETRRLLKYDTVEIKAWRILENTHKELGEKSIGQFYDGDSYIYSWKFRQTVTGRELNGKPSKHSQVGRDTCIFFCWHGSKSSITEKCTAAFLTVELDQQNAPQVRIVQGSEPAAFLRLFNGSMVIHQGKRDEVNQSDKPRLFMARGEMEEEAYLMEVPLEMASLRSRSSFVLFNGNEVIIWHGCKASKQKQKVTRDVTNKILKNNPDELLFDNTDLEIVEVKEGRENESFLDAIGSNRSSYYSLLDSDKNFEFTPRLFKMSSITGNFIATELLCPHRSEHSSPYPFVQSELYTSSQPGLLLFDNNHELWLWQGWWPENDEDSELNTDQTGSGAIRWQAERRAAMQTAVNYWKKTHDEDEPVVAHLVWAGLEPLEFRNLFPMWEVREDVRELNLQDGKNYDDKLNLQRELALLSRTTYPLDEILQRPLPEGVDPTQLEIYLSDADFETLLEMSKEEFEKLPSWKKTALKKEKGLF